MSDKYTDIHFHYLDSVAEEGNKSDKSQVRPVRISLYSQMMNGLERCTLPTGPQITVLVSSLLIMLVIHLDIKKLIITQPMEKRCENHPRRTLTRGNTRPSG